jgi:hypothetical protein
MKSRKTSLKKLMVLSLALGVTTGTLAQNKIDPAWKNAPFAKHQLPKKSTQRCS